MSTSRNSIINAQNLPLSTTPLSRFLWLQSSWLIWSVTVAFVLFQFTLQMSAGVIIDHLMTSFHLSAFGGGMLVGGFYYVYVLLQTPAGSLVDHFGPRRLLTAGALLCAVGCLLFAMSHGLLVAFLGRILMGLGASCAFVSSLHVANLWFPVERFAFMVGLSETLAMTGTLLGNVYLAHLLQIWHWRMIMIFAAILSLILAFLCGILVKDIKNTHLKNSTDTLNALVKSKTELPLIKKFSRDIWKVMTKPMMWINGFYIGMIFSVLTVFATLWGIPFLMKAQNISRVSATFESSMVFIGIAIGSPIMGWLYPRLSSLRVFLCCTALLEAVFMSYIIFWTPQSLVFTALLFLFLGLFCSCYVMNFSIANDCATPTTRSTSIGFSNMLCMIFAPFLQPLVGWLAQNFSQQNTGLQVEHISTISGFHHGLLVLPIGLVMASVIAFWLPKDRAATFTQSE